MRRLFYTLSIFSFFLVLGCQREVSFHEIGNTLFTVDENGDVFVIDERGSSIKKIKVETFIDPLPFELKNDKITETRIIDWNNHNMKVIITIKYIGETCHYRLEVTNNDTLNKWIDTNSYSRILEDPNHIFTINMVEKDRFTLSEFLIEHKRDLSKNYVEGPDLTGFEYVGTVSISKNLFSKVTDISISTNIDPQL